MVLEELRLCRQELMGCQKVATGLVSLVDWVVISMAWVAYDEEHHEAVQPFSEMS